MAQGIRLKCSSLRTLDTHTCCQAFGSGVVTTCFYDLCLSRLGFEHPTFRIRGERCNRLRHRDGTTLSFNTYLLNIFDNVKSFFSMRMNTMACFHLFRFYILIIRQPLVGTSRKALWEIHTNFKVHPNFLYAHMCYR